MRTSEMQMSELREMAYDIDPRRATALESLWEDGELTNKELVWGLEDIITGAGL